MRGPDGRYEALFTEHVLTTGGQQRLTSRQGQLEAHRADEVLRSGRNIPRTGREKRQNGIISVGLHRAVRYNSSMHVV